MFRKLRSKLVAGLAAVACGACAMGVWAQAGFAADTASLANAETAATPVLTIESNNVSYSDSVFILYAVNVQNVDTTANTVQMLFWNESQTDYVAGTEAYVAESKGWETVNEKECMVFYSNGLAAKEMTDDVYCRAYVEVDGTAYYSEVKKYSVLQYVYEIRQTNTEEVYATMYEAMLNYGGAAQQLFSYNTDRLANATYYTVSVANATFADGFNYGLYQHGEVLTVTPNEGYEFTDTPTTEYTVAEDGTILLTVPEADFTDTTSFTVATVDPEPEPDPEPEEPTNVFTNTYVFSDYTAGTQYAENEEHVLDDVVTVTTDKAHFTTQLRLYSSATNNSTAIIAASNVIDKITLNAGYKADILNIYGSVDSVTFTEEPIATVTTTGAYADYEVDIDENGFYRYLKLDVEGDQQIRIASFSITIFNEGKEPQMDDEAKLNAAANGFTVNDFVLDGASEVTLSTETNFSGVTVAWSTDNENVKLVDATLYVPNEDMTFTLTATLTCGEYSTAKTCTVTVNYVMTSADKVAAAKNEFVFDVTTANGGSEIILPTETNYEDVTVTWTLTETEYATLDGNVLSLANPVSGATVRVTANFSCEGAAMSWYYDIEVVYILDSQKVQLAADAFTLDFTEMYVDTTKTLSTESTDADVVVTWTLPEGYSDSATLENNVLTAKAEATIELIATFSYETESATKTFEINFVQIPTLTIAEAIAKGAEQAENAYTSEMYYATGTITEFYNNGTTYGNVYIQDEHGDSIIVYGLYLMNDDGTQGDRYDKMETKPGIGDTIKILAIVGNYSGTPQFKDAFLIELTVHTHEYESVVTAPTCTVDGFTTYTCSICQDTYKADETTATGHTTENGTCGNCGQEISPENPGLTEKTYSYTFTSKVFSANGTQTLGDVNWTVDGDGGYWGNDSTKGQQLGSGSKPYKSLTVSSDSFSNVSNITINTSGASSVKATCDVYVGDTKVGTITLTASATEYSFDVSGLTGEVRFVYTQTSSKAIYIKSIAVTYAE